MLLGPYGLGRYGIDLKRVGLLLFQLSLVWQVNLLSLATLSRLLRLERLIVDDAIVARVETI